MTTPDDFDAALAEAIAETGVERYAPPRQRRQHASGPELGRGFPQVDPRPRLAADRPRRLHPSDRPGRLRRLSMSLDLDLDPDFHAVLARARVNGMPEMETDPSVDICPRGCASNRLFARRYAVRRQAPGESGSYLEHLHLVDDELARMGLDGAEASGHDAEAARWGQRETHARGGKMLVHDDDLMHQHEHQALIDDAASQYRTVHVPGA